MSSPPAADEKTLQKIGEEIIQSIIALCTKSILWTIYLILIGISANILMKQRSVVAAFTFLVVLAMFLIDTAMYFIDISDAVKVVSYILTSHSDVPLSDRSALLGNIPYSVQSVLYAFMSNLGDIIVIWRVYAFYPRGQQRWVLVLPIALLAASFVTSGLISFCVAQLVSDEDAAGDFVHPAFCKNIQLTSYCTTFATTAVATLLISYKTWEYRRTIGNHLQESSSTKTRIERIATILIESGILYSLFFLQAVISDSGDIGALEHSTTGLIFGGTIWTYNMSHVLGIYPVIIVILVHSQRSYIESMTAWSASTLPSTSFRSAHLSTVLSHPTMAISNAGASIQGLHTIQVDVHEVHASDDDTTDQQKPITGLDDCYKPNTVEKGGIETELAENRKC